MFSNQMFKQLFRLNNVIKINIKKYIYIWIFYAFYECLISKCRKQLRYNCTINTHKYIEVSMRRREHVHQSLAYNIVYIVHTYANQRDVVFQI